MDTVTKTLKPIRRLTNAAATKCTFLVAARMDYKTLLFLAT